jgi:type I restriction enzyme S subunit
MIDDLKAYASYKDSGVAWLGQVPEHWEVRRLRNVAEMRVSNVDKHTKAGEMPVRLCNYVDVYKNERITDRVGFMRATALPREIERFRLQLGDVLITKDSESWNDIGVPALVEYTAEDLLCGYHLALLRPLECLYGRFFLRLLQSISVAYQFHIEANGVTRYGLSHGAIKSIWVPIPPPAEQADIVRFLDHADRRIRSYIDAKQKLIKLLEEEKQAIILRAVTRGLDPNVRFKPSGVEWLGDVPQHWVVKLLHHVLDPAIPLAYGILLPGPRLDEGVPYLGAGDVRPDRLRLDALPRTTGEIAAAYPRTRMRAGELVYAIRGSFGSVEVIPPELDGVNLSRDAARLAPRSGINAFWLAFLLRSRFCQEQFRLKEIGATVTGVNIRDLKRVVVPVPPFEEQEAIVQFLDQEINVIDRAVGRAEREVSLLREYRNRLIADVVTGKFDVREAAKNLPDDTPEPEPLDEIDDLSQDEPAAEVSRVITSRQQDTTRSKSNPL